MSRLAGKVVIISNAHGRQGQSQARLFAREGATVIIASPDARINRILVDELSAAIYPVKLRVDAEEEWEAAAAHTLEQFGQIDILVNNSIASTPHLLVDTGVEEWEQSLRSGIKGSFFGTRAVLPTMRKHKKGAIVNVTSIAAMAPPRGTTEAHASVSGALRILTKDISADYAAEGIRCNTVHAGLIDGELLGTGAPLDNASAADVIENTPMQRQGTHDEVARAVLFLASDDASFITGTELIVDGGYVGF